MQSINKQNIILILVLITLYYYNKLYNFSFNISKLKLTNKSLF